MALALAGAAARARRRAPRHPRPAQPPLRGQHQRSADLRRRAGGAPSGGRPGLLPPRPPRRADRASAGAQGRGLNTAAILILAERFFRRLSDSYFPAAILISRLRSLLFGQLFLFCLSDSYFGAAILISARRSLIFLPAILPAAQRILIFGPAILILALRFLFWASDPYFPTVGASPPLTAGHSGTHLASGSPGRNTQHRFGLFHAKPPFHAGPGGRPARRLRIAAAGRGSGRQGAAGRLLARHAALRRRAVDGQPGAGGLRHRHLQGGRRRISTTSRTPPRLRGLPPVALRAARRW